VEDLAGHQTEVHGGYSACFNVKDDPDWRLWLVEELPAEDLAANRTAARQGIPFATPAFLRELERLTGIPLLPRRLGRPSRFS
jgi:hypothetical protein